MRVLCVARHPFLSEHLCRFFDALGVETIPCVGMDDAIGAASGPHLDAIICDYDLLTTTPLTNWETNPAVSSIPLIAVSLTRHPPEEYLLDVNGIAGFLYLPTLEAEDAQRVLAGVRRKRSGITPPSVLSWPGTTPVAQQL